MALKCPEIYIHTLLIHFYLDDNERYLDSCMGTKVEIKLSRMSNSDIDGCTGRNVKRFSHLILLFDSK